MMGAADQIQPFLDVFFMGKAGFIPFPFRLEEEMCIRDSDIICTEKIIAERKTFFLDLKQNARGKVVRITEKVSSNRDRIMVPAEILDDFIAALQDIRAVSYTHLDVYKRQPLWRA